MKKYFLLLIFLLLSVNCFAGLGTSRDNTKVKKSGDILTGGLLFPAPSSANGNFVYISSNSLSYGYNPGIGNRARQFYCTGNDSTGYTFSFPYDTRLSMNPWQVDVLNWYASAHSFYSWSAGTGLIEALKISASSIDCNNVLVTNANNVYANGGVQGLAGFLTSNLSLSQDTQNRWKMTERNNAAFYTDLKLKALVTTDYISVGTNIQMNPGYTVDGVDVSQAQIDTTTLNNLKLDKSGGTMTGDLYVGTITATYGYFTDMHVSSVTIVTAKSTQTVTDYLGSQNYTNVTMTSDLNLAGYKLYGGQIIDAAIQAATTTATSRLNQLQIDTATLQAQTTNNKSEIDNLHGSTLTIQGQITNNTSRLNQVQTDTTTLQNNKLDLTGGTISGSLTVQQNIIASQLISGKWFNSSSSSTLSTVYVTALYTSGFIYNKDYTGTRLNIGGVSNTLYYDTDSRGRMWTSDEIRFKYQNGTGSPVVSTYTFATGTLDLAGNLSANTAKMNNLVVVGTAPYYTQAVSDSQYTVRTATDSCLPLHGTSDNSAKLNNQESSYYLVASSGGAIDSNTSRINQIQIDTTTIQAEIVSFSTATLIFIFSSTDVTTASMIGQYVDLPICFDYTPKEWEVWGSTTGSFTCSLTTAAFASVPVFGNSIAGSDSPRLNGVVVASSSTALTGWGGTIPAGYCLRMSVLTSTIDQLTVKICVWRKK